MLKRFRMVFLFLIICTVVFSLYAALTLAEVQSIRYNWYSDYFKTFVSNPRDDIGFNWNMQDHEDPALYVITDSDNMAKLLPAELLNCDGIAGFDFKDQIMIYAALGEKNTYDYSIRISGVKCRGQMLYIRVSANSPNKESDMKDKSLVYDIAAVKRSDLIINKNLKILFEDNKGNKLKMVSI